MKIFTIYFSQANALDYPLNKQVFFESYAEIIEKLAQENIKAVIVRGNSYLWNRKFSHYFKWNGNTFVKVDEEITTDLIWNRDSENVIPQINDCPILNSQDFDELCRDKISTYENFKDFSAKTFLLNSYDDLLKNISKIETELIVLKPRFGEQCQWIFIIKKDEISPDLYEDWTDVLLQDFLDSSCWIQGLVEGLHEINVFCINWRFAWARVKKPAEGNLISSATGSSIWKVWWITEEQVPTELKEELAQLDKSLEKFPLRLYRADFVYTTLGKFKMIEMNSRPGIMHPDKEWKDFYWDFNGSLIDLVVENI